MGTNTQTAFVRPTKEWGNGKERTCTLIFQENIPFCVYIFRIANNLE